MLLVDLLEEAKNSNWNVTFSNTHHDPVVKSELISLQIMGIYYLLVREKKDISPIMKHNKYHVYQDYELCDPIYTMREVSKDYPASNLQLIINFNDYIDQVVSQDFSLYTCNPQSYIHSQFETFESTIEFYSPSRNKEHKILLTELDNSKINKMKLIAKDFFLRGVTINTSTIIDDLKACKWDFDIGDYDE